MNRRERRHKKSLERREIKRFNRQQSNVKKKPHFVVSAKNWNRMIDLRRGRNE